MQKIAINQDTTMAYNAVLRQVYSWQNELVLRRKTPRGKLENWLLFDTLPQLRPFIFGIMARVEGEELGEVSILKILPGESLPISEQEQAIYFLPLDISPGVIAKSDTTEMVLPGDVWWAPGKAGVMFQNNSQTPAVLLVLSITPNGPATYIPEE